MVRPPIPPTPKLTDNSEAARHNVPVNRGYRRNFEYETIKRPHRYPVGTEVYVWCGIARMSVGPLYVKEHCPALLPRGLPNYVLQASMDGDDDMWTHAYEGNVFEVDQFGHRIL